MRGLSPLDQTAFGPAREGVCYAVHKLVVTCLRAGHDQARTAKDIAQCSAIIEAKRLTGMVIDLGDRPRPRLERGA